ncbi:MAG TPA: hypothetical protein VMA75_05000 [Candidatus Paceibacterota bacterium]|nr:hypothetical protein [Candidatus Paceibacterota bacterium]
MKNHNNRQMNKQFVSQPTAWVLACIYGTAVANLFNQGGYSINPT